MTTANATATAVSAPSPSLPQTITIQTPRLVLRTTTSADSPRLGQIYSDPVTMSHLAFLLHDWTVEEVETRRLERAERQRRNVLIALTIVPVSDPDEVLGSCGCRFIDLVGRTAEWGCILDARKGHGRGYGTEVFRALVGYVVEELGIEEVMVTTAGKNRPMRSMMEKLEVPQCWPDGLGQPGKSGASIEDPVCYRVTSDLWPTLRAKLDRKMERVLAQCKGDGN
ncbi:hypothetical protein HKX48_003296 [Thoreauomyces humboldtii]|nr:hypothetical protein HKX48_003296 [Thoreauomyces humboldtii]